MRLCPKCELDFLVTEAIEGQCGERYIEYRCYECGYWYLEPDEPEDWTKNDYDLIEGDDGG